MCQNGGNSVRSGNDVCPPEQATWRVRKTDCHNEGWQGEPGCESNVTS